MIPAGSTSKSTLYRKHLISSSSFFSGTIIIKRTFKGTTCISHFTDKLPSQAAQTSSISEATRNVLQTQTCPAAGPPYTWKQSLSLVNQLQ